jgi:hypothetical protein
LSTCFPSPGLVPHSLGRIESADSFPYFPWDHSPSFKSEKITENKEIRKWFDSYLGMGEWIMDQSVAFMGSSSWFERRR